MTCMPIKKQYQNNNNFFDIQRHSARYGFWDKNMNKYFNVNYGNSIQYFNTSTTLPLGSI